MVQERNSIWPLLFTASCLLALSIAPPFLVDNLYPDSGTGSSEQSRSELLVATTADDSQYFSYTDEPGYHIAASDVLVAVSTSVPSVPANEVARFEPTEAKPAEVSDRVASQVIEQPPVEPVGPRLAEQNTANKSADSVAATNQASENKPVEKEPINTAMLSKWVRRLPSAVANLRKSSKREMAANRQYNNTVAKPAKASEPEVKPQPPQPSRQEMWPEPTALIEQLQSLTEDGPTGRWAGDVLSHVQALGPAIVGGSDEASAITLRLNNLALAGHKMAGAVSDRSQARNLRRAAYALQRRIDVWENIIQLDSHDLSKTIPIVLDARGLARSLARIDAVTGDSAVGEAWRKYLMIGPMKESLALGNSPDEAKLREIARRILFRLSQSRLNAEQYLFITSEPVTDLRNELKSWAAVPISFADLLRDIERYERTDLPSDARRLAMDSQCLAVSPIKTHRNLSDIVDFHYRNANFRLAITEKLLNYLIPEQKLEYAPVNDRVLNRPTRGKSLMATEAALRMRPNPDRISLTLEVTGEIQSFTTTDAGLAKFHNNSKSYYIARKPLEVNLGGISLWPSEVNVYNETRLQGVETSMDGIPVFRRLAESVARSQHDQNKPAANREVRKKVADKARERIDAEVHKKFASFVERLNQRVFDPLNSLTLDPQLIEAETTDKRLTMRVRLAGQDQLGSHTPRPRAPSDSLASVQLHETVLNNGLQRLELAGRTFTLSELADHISARLNCPPPWDTNPDNKDVKISFAERNPVVVRCEDGRVMLTLSIRRLSKSPRSWSYFQIRAFYRPEIDGCSALLMRDGVIQLIGKRLTIGSQIALRGVFSSVLSKGKPLKLVDNPTIRNEKLKDTEISQFVIEDGWIGISLRQKSTIAGRRPSESRK